MADSPEERAHWRDVLRAFDGYMQYHLAANHGRRMAFLSLPRDTRDVFEHLGYRDKLEAVDEGIRRNAEFIDLMIQDPVFADMLGGDGDGDGDDPAPTGDVVGHAPGHTPPLHAPGAHRGPHSHSHAQPHPHGHSHSHGHGHGHGHGASPKPSTPSSRGSERDVQQDKVRSTLRSFVRDWAAEGAGERAAAYGPILAALEAYYPDVAARAGVKVLVPGCGLGRLAMEIAARGFWAQGNEFSTYMLIASHFALNQYVGRRGAELAQPAKPPRFTLLLQHGAYARSTTAEEHVLFPWLHSFSNHLSTGDGLLRSVRVPDVVPAEILAGREGGFSLVAGDFEEVYGPDHWHEGSAETGDDEEEHEATVNQRGRWGAVVTCFFIDTARNVLNYLRIIHGLLDEGGVWINLGPLLWHFENSPSSAKGEGSIELSLDEVKELARMVGFELRNERTVQTTYTGVPDNMLQHVYDCAFWTATKVGDGARAILPPAMGGGVGGHGEGSDGDGDDEADV